MRRNDRIDVHHHIIPQIYRDALESLGVGTSGGLVMRSWASEDSIAHMDALGVQTAICSISEPALYPFVLHDPKAAQKLARQLNEYMAKLCDAHPGRFGAFAVLPMPDVEAAIEELRYALDVLHLDGVGLLSNYGSEYLGNRAFEPLFKELNERKAPVYIHPSVPPAPDVMPRPEFMPLDYMAEFCFNTMRAAANMIYGGTMQRFPDIKPILSHMGGTLPYLVWRLEACRPSRKVAKEKRRFADFVYDGWESLEKTVDDYAGMFYFDTALATHRPAFDAVEQLAKGHTLFGSDSFYASTNMGKNFVEIIEGFYTDEDALYAVCRGNAERLFPRFAQGGGAGAGRV